MRLCALCEIFDTLKLFASPKKLCAFALFARFIDIIGSVFSEFVAAVLERLKYANFTAVYIYLIIRRLHSIIFINWKTGGKTQAPRGRNLRVYSIRPKTLQDKP
ncbi:hypothetical protein CIK91_07155 [Segatella bryantii]|uniref:Uncharacterized protein n=1 Tax=Segatella bryantii TaxID=77095 RepID=A0ABX4EKH6_SEGBR|nr:hypothetical protein CIK91_07155 [Segatella bryantii]